MAEIKIGGRLHSVAIEQTVANSDEIYDKVEGKKQETINAELRQGIADAGNVNDVTVNNESVVNPSTKIASIVVPKTASAEVLDEEVGIPTATAEMRGTDIHFAFSQIKGEKGDTGNGIANVTEERSYEDGGTNVVTIKFTDPNVPDAKVRTMNGGKGTKGDSALWNDDPDKIVNFAHELGNSDLKLVSQKGVTDAIANINSFDWKPTDVTKKSNLTISSEGVVSEHQYRYLFCVPVTAGDVVQMFGTGPQADDIAVVVALFSSLPVDGSTALEVIDVSETVNGEYVGKYYASANGYLVMRLYGATATVTAQKAQSVKDALTDVKTTVDFIGDLEVTGWDVEEVSKLSNLDIKNDGEVYSKNYRYIFYAPVEAGDIVKMHGINQASESVIVALFDDVPEVGSVATVLDNSEAVDGVYDKTFRAPSSGYIAIKMYGTSTVGSMQKASKIKDLVKTVKGESEVPTYTTTTGKYITRNNTIGTASGFSYTSPIKVNKGDNIVFSSDCGTSGLCSCIALTDSQGTAYKSQMAEKGFAKRIYDVVEDGYVVFSFITAKGLSVTIYRGSMVRAVERMESVAESLMVDSKDGAVVPSSNPLARLISGPSRVRTFKSYGIIGASFETGYTNANENGSASPFYDEGYEWPTLLGKTNGVEVYNYALAGHAFKQWLRDRNDSPHFTGHNVPWNTDDHQPECFIINMSSNELDSAKNSDPAGSALDIDLSVDYSEMGYGEHASFAEVVAAIIQLCRKKSPQCYIFVATVRGGIGDDEERKTDLNDALVGVAGLFERCYVLDIYKYGMDWSKLGYLSGSKTSHPTRLGHVYLADQFNTYIDWFIGKYPELFMDAAYINTGKTRT